MTTTLTPLPRADIGWLNTVAQPYFGELAPDLPPLPDDAFDIWWDDPQRCIHLVQFQGTASGFAMVWQDEEGIYELSEFCILPNLRRQGIGTRAATLCFTMHPGRWRLGVAHALPGTARFWDRLLPGLIFVRGLARGAALTPYQSHSYTFTAQEQT